MLLEIGPDLLQARLGEGVGREDFRGMLVAGHW